LSQDGIPTNADLDAELDSVESSDDEQVLEWLLNQDYSDEPEQLFSLREQARGDFRLTAFEADMASRPMTRGDRTLDDLSKFVGEEIVMDGASGGNDIYAGDSESAVMEVPAYESPLTVDLSQFAEGSDEHIAVEVPEGADILGLSDEDDIGEQFVVIKKVVSQVESTIESPPQETVASEAVASQVEKQPESNTEAPLEIGLESAAQVPATETELELDLPEFEFTTEAQSNLEVDQELPELEFTTEAPSDLAIDQELPELEFITEAQGDLEDDQELPEFEFATEAQSDLEIDQELPELELVDELQAAPETPLSGSLLLHDSEPLVQVETIVQTDTAEPEFNDDETPAQESALGENVLDYVTGNKAPTEDEAFDQFLLEGEHLGAVGSDSFEMSVENTEGVVSVDPDPVAAIDYHEDFAIEEQIGEDEPVNFTVLVARAMEALSVAVASRLSDLGLPSESIQVEMMLGSDSDALLRSIEDNFVPIDQTALDVAPLGFGPDAGHDDELYVRMLHVGSGHCWNELLSRDFIVPEAELSMDNEEASGSAILLDDQPLAGFNLDADGDDNDVWLEDALADSGLEDVLNDALSDENLSELDTLAEPIGQMDEAFAELEDIEFEGAGDSVESDLLETMEAEFSLEGELAVDVNSESAHDEFAELDDILPEVVIVAEEAVEEVTEELAEEVAEELAEEVAEELTEEVAEELTEEVAEELAEEVTEELAEEVTEELAEEVTEELAEEAAEELTEEVAEELTEEVPEELTEEVPEELAEEVTEELAEEVAEELTEEVPEELAEELTEELAEETTENVSQEASEPEEALTGRETSPVKLTQVKPPVPASPLGALDSPYDLSELEGGSMDVDAMLQSFGETSQETDELLHVALDEFDRQETEDYATGEEPVEEDAQEAALMETASWCVPEDIGFSDSSESSGEIFAEFLDAFCEEASTELDKLEDVMGLWEQDIASEKAYEPIPRILHTLKGIAKGIGLHSYGTLIHNFETLLERLPRPEAGEDTSYFRIVNAWLDASVTAFEQVRETREDIETVFPQQKSKPIELGEIAGVAGDFPEQASEEVASEQASEETASEQAPEEAEPEQEKIAAKPANVIPLSDAATRRKQQTDKQLAEEGAKALAGQQTIRMTPEAVDHLLSLTNQAQQLGVRSSQAILRSKGATSELQGRLSSVRSHIAKIADRALANVTAMGNKEPGEMDALEMDQYSELQEAANILREGVEDLDDLINVSSRQNSQVEALLKQQASAISFLGSSIQAARVVPISRLMPGLRRLVRTVSSDLGKVVQFRVLSETGSLDRDNHARCQVILEHMVRNALDHGIESPEDRIASGKPPAGQIFIDVKKAGSDYMVSLRDDGRGIDPHTMRETAFDKGLDVDVDALSDDEALRLIFHKGFSTATTVSQISGRGVGMDIVLSELQHIGGDIEIKSEVGKGTTFNIRIPSNMTMNGALLVAAGRVSYAIPLDGLIAVEHVPADDFYDAVEQSGKLELFGFQCEPSYLATLCHGEGLPERKAWGTTVPVIIAGSQGRHMAIAVDDLKQALELVIRSLGVQFSMVPGVTGAATTADGQAIVALDLNTLVESLSPEEQSTLSVEKEEDERMLVLVVDDSRTQRLVATSRFDGLGVETVTAENGLVAMEFLNTTHRLPDVVLLDVEMPVKDGIQTLRDIRNSSRLQDLPVIMVTSRTGAKHRALAEEAGCNGYMGKPFNFPLLVEMIAELTSRELELI
jgi:chemotaxis protein histidine kinase CheA/CheY-like chemotaxis protein